MLATPDADRALAHPLPQGSQTLSEAPGGGEQFVYSISLGTLADDGTITWDDDEGPPVTLTELLAANPDSDVSEAADQLAGLEIGESLDFGGGAAPLGRITRVDPHAIPDDGAVELAAFLANLTASIASEPGPVYGPYPAAKFTAPYDLNAFHDAVRYVATHGGWMRTRRPFPDEPFYVVHEVFGCTPADARPVAPPAPPPVVEDDGIYTFFKVPRPSLDAVNAGLIVALAGAVL